MFSESHKALAMSSFRKQSTLPTKISNGVILCRINHTNGRPEVLLAHKRYTYAFADFIHGQYAWGHVHHTLMGTASHLFNNMTVEELLDIWSLRFDQMWYRVWLMGGSVESYKKKAAKFASTFIDGDGGVALRNAIKMVRGKGVLLWEVPKGRRLNQNELDVGCAVRELAEETGYTKDSYQLIPNVRKQVSHVSDGVRYNCVYFLALLNPDDTLTRNDTMTLQMIREMGEINETRWFDIEQIRMLKCPWIDKLIAPSFKLIKTYINGKWDRRVRIDYGRNALLTAASKQVEKEKKEKQESPNIFKI